MDINKILEQKKNESKVLTDHTLPPHIPTENILTTVRELPLQIIKEDPSQPRKTYNEETIKALAESIKEKGLLQPIVVKPDGSGYLIIVGHRRYRAFTMMKKKEIPCIVKEEHLTKNDLTILALLENLQREDLNTAEICTSLYQLKKLKNISQQEISTVTGYSKGTVSKYIQLYEKVHDDSVKEERLKQLGFEKGYNHFCVVRKKAEENIVKGKRLSIKLHSEKDAEEVKRTIKKVRAYLDYLERLAKTLKLNV